MHRLTSRVFWVGIVAIVFSMASTLGYDLPIDKVMVVDGVMLVVMLILAVRDMVQGK